jgi:hypothetical protein
MIILAISIAWFTSWSIKRYVDYLLLGSSVLMIGIFISHNYYSSGWLLYPSTLINIFEVDWKVPEYLADNMSIVISNWAKDPGDLNQVLETAKKGTLDQFRAYWNYLDIFGKVLIILGLSSSLTWITRSVRSSNSRMIAVSISTLMMIIIWLVHAPSLRYGLQYLLFPKISR